MSLCVRWLHSYNPLSNILLLKGLEAQIGDQGTAHLVDSKKKSQMTKSPGTIYFLPPEAVAANTPSVQYGKELNVYLFSCIMLHILSHQWSAPSEATVTDPVTFEIKGYKDAASIKIDRNRLGVLIPLIECCLGNLPMNRTSIVTPCEQLKDLVDSIYVPADLDILQEERPYNS